MAKIYRPPKDSRDTIINANIGDISDTVHSQSPFHHVQQKRLLELKFPNWKEWDFIYELYYKQENISVYWSWSLPPPIQQNHHSKFWRDKHQQNHKQSRASEKCAAG